MTVPPSAPVETKKRMRTLRVLRWPSFVLGILLIGGALTYLVLPPTVVSSDIPVQIDPDALLNTGNRAQRPMPSVLGLEREVAATVLHDAGIDSGTVTVAEQTAAGPAGIVLRQSPASGTTTGRPVNITVSVPALVPNLAGRTESEAGTTLERLGAVVQISRDVNFDVPHGVVLTTDPAPGQPTPTVVTLHVADAGEALTLSDVVAIDSDCSGQSDTTVNGVTFANSVACSSRANNVVAAEYSLSRNAEALEATVGTDDREGTGQATVTVFGDGNPLSTTHVGLGRSEPIRVRTHGIMRLRIEVTTGDKDQAPTVVLGDARLIGSKTGLDAISGSK